MRDLSTRAKELIEQIEYVTIASVSHDGNPWNSPVFSAYDEEFNFYWGTHKDSQKARNIRDTGKVFLVIYNSTVPSGTGEGVYIKASAQQLVDPSEIKNAFELLKNRHEAPFWEFEAVQESGPIRLFKAVPQKFWMNDDGKKDGFYIDIRTEIKL
jgi:general stress protein 26